VVRDWVKAGRTTDGAVDIFDRSADPADDVMVVVPNPRLVAGWGARRLDPPDEVTLGEDPQNVIDGLGRDRAVVGAYGSRDRVGVGVRVSSQFGQDGPAGSGDPQACGTQSFIDIGSVFDGLIPPPNLE
jgi:hypothetical protein